MTAFPAKFVRAGVRIASSLLSPPIVVGGVLVAAALMKVQYSWGADWIAQGLEGLALLRLVLVPIEFALGIALLLNIRPQLFRCLSIVLFSAFCGYNILRGFRGAQSCACFLIEINPWLTAGFDLGILLLLYQWRFVPSTASSFLLRGALVPLGILIVPVAWSFYSEPSFVHLPKRINLGIIIQGETHRSDMRIRNGLNRAITITVVEVSCRCLHLPNVPWQLDANGETLLPLMVNLADDPAFTGDLKIGIRGGTEAESYLFRTEIQASVIRR